MSRMSRQQYAMRNRDRTFLAVNAVMKSCSPVWSAAAEFIDVSDELALLIEHSDIGALGALLSPIVDSDLDVPSRCPWDEAVFIGHEQKHGLTYIWHCVKSDRAGVGYEARRSYMTRSPWHVALPINQDLRGENEDDALETMMDCCTVLTVAFSLMPGIEVFTQQPNRQSRRTLDPRIGGVRVTCRVIDPSRVEAARVALSDAIGTMPEHRRRGHMAMYKKPMFGTRGGYRGPIWRPQTTVGDRRNGIVIKDYIVLPPSPDGDSVADGGPVS